MTTLGYAAGLTGYTEPRFIEVAPVDTKATRYGWVETEYDVEAYEAHLDVCFDRLMANAVQYLEGCPKRETDMTAIRAKRNGKVRGVAPRKAAKARGDLHTQRTTPLSSTKSIEKTNSTRHQEWKAEANRFKSNRPSVSDQLDWLIKTDVRITKLPSTAKCKRRSML